MEAKTILKLQDVKKYFPIQGGILKRTVAQVHAVDGVSLEIKEGQTLGVVGESGCGKSTLGRTILHLHSITDGKMYFDGQDITNLSRAKMRPFRRDMQIVFQDPFFSLNPRHTVREILMEPLRIHKVGKTRKERMAIILSILEKVGMRENALFRYPHEFSGGQRQRIGIARALVLNPKLIIADEPVSALDVSIQSQILNLLRSLQEEFGLTYLFIAHDLAVVEHISTHIAVMYLGEVVEKATSEALNKTPMHPYTQALISAIPIPDPDKNVDRIILEGDVPSPIYPPSGCRFHPRCPKATERCKTDRPKLQNISGGPEEHLVSCHLYDQT